MYLSVSILHLISQQASNELINLKINIEHLSASKNKHLGNNRCQALIFVVSEMYTQLFQIYVEQS
jgi:hypothetical protein